MTWRRPCIRSAVQGIQKGRLVTGKKIIGLTGLTILLVFCIVTAWEFFAEPQVRGALGIQDLESDYDRWHDIWMVTIATTAATGFLGLIAFRVSRQRQSVENALVDNTTRFRDFAESTSDWFWELDRNLRVKFVSDTFLRKFALTAGDVAGIDHFDLWRGFDEQNRTWYITAIESRQPVRNISFDVLLADGGTVHYRISGKPIFDSGGNFLGYRGTGQDISSEVAIRRRQREAETRLHSAIEAISEGFVMFDAEDRLVLCNSQFRDLYSASNDLWVPGAKFEDIIRTGVQRGQYPTAIGRTEEWVAARMEQFHGAHAPFERQLPDGRWIKLADTHTPDGYMVGIRTDITEQMQRNQQLKESEERYRRLIDLSPDGIMVVCNDDIVFCNAAFAKIHGADRTEQLVGRNIMTIIPPEDRAIVVKRRWEARNGQGGTLREAKNIRLDGTEVDVEKCLVRITWQGKEAFMILVRDITDRKKRDEQLRQTQKMEALGTLAGGIAHDLNNALVPVLALTELSIQDLPLSSAIRENLQVVMKAASQGQEIVQQILKFSRSEESEREPLDMKEVVRESMPLLRATLPPSIKIETDIDGFGTLTVNADRVQIHQILMNLASNASSAIGLKSGVLRIALESIERGEPLQRQHPNLNGLQYAKLTVSDTGPGIDAVTLGRIFEPFFTTKDVGKGTGLGLSVVHAIVEAHGGAIIGSSQPGEGATFEIYLPLHPLDNQSNVTALRRTA